MLRCYPRSIEEKQSFKPPSRQIIPKSFPKVVKQVTPEVSSEASSDDSPSDDGSQSGFGGLFDGAGDVRFHTPESISFGGDATWEQPSDWNNGGQGSWNQGGESQAWAGANDSDGTNMFPAPGNGWEPASGNAQPPRWDTRTSSSSNHFSDDWNNPSQTTQEPAQRVSRRHSNRESRRSDRSSSSHHHPPALGTNNNWGDSNPIPPSPAIVINVNHSPSPSRFGPPSVADSWAEKPLPANMQPSFSFARPPQSHKNSPNGSNNSGSNKSVSNRSNGSKDKNNDGKDWQATAGQTQNWGTDNQNSDASGWQNNAAQSKGWGVNNQSNAGNGQPTAGQAQDWGAETPKVAGAWGESDNKLQETPHWKNDNNGGGIGWDAPNKQSSKRQNNYNGNSWNHRGDSGGWQNIAANGSVGQAQGGHWTKEQIASAYPDWASPTAQNQQSKTSSNNPTQQQDTWTSGNAGGNGNGNGSGSGSGSGDKPEELAWGGNNGYDTAKDEPVGLFGSIPIPASESAKREESIKPKHLNQAPAFTFGLPESPIVGQPPAATLTRVAGATPIPSRAKPYWSTWNHVPLDEEPDIDEEPVCDPEPAEGPLYSVPAEFAQRTNMSHQVQVGKPAVYVHKMSKPKYMDTHENPYAAFTFHYRSRAVIEKMFGVSLAETEEEERERLSSLSKEELIEHYLKAKASASSQKSSSTSNDSNKQNKLANGGLGLGGDLVNKLSQLSGNIAPSEKASKNPELHWGRPVSHENGWNKAAATSNANVAGWLSNGGGGGVGSPPISNTGESNIGNAPAGVNWEGSWSNGNQHSGNGAQANNEWAGNSSNNNNGNGNGDGGSNGNSRINGSSGGNGNNNPKNNGNLGDNNGGGNQYAGSWGNGSGNGASWNNGSNGGNGNGGQNGNEVSWANGNNGGTGNDSQNGNGSSWNHNGGGNPTGGLWNGGKNGNQHQGSWNGSGNRNQKDSSWDNNGPGTASWNAGGVDNSGGVSTRPSGGW